MSEFLHEFPGIYRGFCTVSRRLPRVVTFDKARPGVVGRNIGSAFA